MIDEKKLIDELKQRGMIADNEYGNAMVDMIESQSKIGGWIPCSERLPENDNYILLSFENFTIPLVGRAVSVRISLLMHGVNCRNNTKNKPAKL